MFAQAAIQLTGPLDHLRLVWQTGETLLDSVVFDEDPEGTRYNILLALQEMVTNVLRHGYRLDESKPIEVCFTLRDELFEITLKDQGPAFNPLGYDDNECSSTEEMPTKCGGFGIHIARLVMDTIDYAREGSSNVLRLGKAVRVIANT